MKNQLGILLLFMFSFSLFSCQGEKKDEWTLVWEDDFNQSDGFDTTRWSKIPRGTADWNKFMTDYDSCYALENSNLILRGIVNTTQQQDTATCLTGGLWTKDKVTFQNGRLEVRAKVDEATGAWPAIWLLPLDKAWPAGGEIDLMEHLNFDSIAYQTIHTNYTLYSGNEIPNKSSVNRIRNNDYNVYALEFYQDSLVFFINDMHTLTYPRIETTETDQFPFEDPFYLLIDMQLGGSWVGKINYEQLPVEMSIDWVRFYQKESVVKKQPKINV